MIISLLLKKFLTKIAKSDLAKKNIVANVLKKGNAFVPSVKLFKNRDNAFFSKLINNINTNAQADNFLAEIEKWAKDNKQEAYLKTIETLSKKTHLNPNQQKMFIKARERAKELNIFNNKYKGKEAGLEYSIMHSSWIVSGVYDFATNEAVFETKKNYSFIVKLTRWEWYAMKAMRGSRVNGAGSWLWHNQRQWMAKRVKKFRIVISPYIKMLMTKDMQRIQKIKGEEIWSE